jgi:hypothetical protein
MDFNSNHSHSNTSWLDSNLEAFPQETLQEPVPFEGKATSQIKIAR